VQQTLLLRIESASHQRKLHPHPLPPSSVPALGSVIARFIRAIQGSERGGCGKVWITRINRVMTVSIVRIQKRADYALTRII
jgi:hypothetical protein